MKNIKQYTQKEIENLIKQYNNSDKTLIKQNTIKILSSCKQKYSDIAKNTGIGVQTLYQYNKDYVISYPNFLTALTLANFLNIDITEFIKEN